MSKSFVKVRSYGGYSNTKRKAYLEHCSRLLDINLSEQPATDEQDNPADTPVETTERSVECPHCRQPMLCIVATDRPSWSLAMRSYRPPWYHDD